MQSPGNLVLLNRAADQAREATADGDAAHAITATSSLQTIFKVQGIIVAVALAFWAIAIVIAIVAVIGNGS